ncbi:MULTISPECIES: SusC/RagA family TonB-linked outer membrane protein [Niastella]|uniref:TonB-dependent receptor n=1 Tax=Niastella soli TaxID=2821487 RepID=A0ABS3Z410_9BACT|nr:TonB-dependent receptor [Niastella soli]MBO9204915.1 TonB-dependent receptor [Niastella soli]
MNYSTNCAAAPKRNNGFGRNRGGGEPGKRFTSFFYLLLVLGIGHLQPAAAQTENTIHGVISNSQGDPLANVSVVVKETKRGTATDSSGQFSIAAKKGQTLVFSMTGYTGREYLIRNDGIVQMSLTASAISLDDVVVIGYGARKKATLTGAVAAVTGREVVTTKNENIQNMLTGKVAGLRVVQNSSEPGSFDNTFDIRGLGTPLVVIDGVPRTNITRLNPADIESVSILKDASAAIYGVRAANGVVLITTKKGKKGKLSLNYNGVYGLQFASRLPKPVGIFDYMTLVNEQRMHTVNGGTPLYTEADFEAYRNGTKVAANWQDAIIRKAAPFTQHDISVSGGTDNTTYFVSLGYLSQDAIFKSDDVNYKRYNMRSNLSTKIARRLTFDVDISGILDEKNQPYISPWYVFRSLWYQPPVQNIYANNNPDYFNNVPSNLNGVAHSRSDVNGYYKQKNKWFQSSVSLTYEVPGIKGLTFKGLYSYDFRDSGNKAYMKAYNLYNYNATNNTYEPVPQQTPATIRRDISQFPGSLLQASVNYNHLFGDHNMSALLLYERNIKSADNFYGQRELSLAVDQLLAGNSLNQQTNTSSNIFYKYINASYVGRLAYDFRGKYFAEFTFREDGSSKFAVNKQWGFFPAGFVAWRISEEKFFKNIRALSFINNFKLRGSYGLTGDENTSTYQFFAGYNYPASGSSTGTPAGAVFDGTFVSAVQSKGLANPNISWYTAKMLNVGVDVQAWRGLLGLTFDVFRRNRSGLLATQALTLPDVVGVGLPQENLNGDRTEGFDLEVNHENHLGKLNYLVKGTLGYTRTMNTTRASARAGNSYLNWNNSNFTAYRWNNLYWGYGADGQFGSYDAIVNSPFYVPRSTVVGDYMYQDWNGDGQISTQDNQPITTAGMPTITYGFTIGAQYKGFDLSMTWNGAGKVYVSYFEQLNTPLWAGGGALEQFMDRWHPLDPTADPYDPNTVWVPGHFAYTGTVPYTNTLANASSAAYLRLKTVELGYTLPQRLLNKAGIKGLRVYANGYNPVTITKLRYLDPEHPSSQFGYLYPLDIKLTFGLNIQL